MSYSVDVHGVAVSCGSPEEAVALAHALQGGRANVVKPAGEPVSMPTAGAILKALLGALFEIQKHGLAGADPKAIAAHFGLDKTDGLGGKMVQVNKFLKSQGFENPQQVLKSTRENNGPRRWVGGDRLNEAIQKLNQVNQGGK
jgi:hypothetical protein